MQSENKGDKPSQNPMYANSLEQQPQPEKCLTYLGKFFPDRNSQLFIINLIKTVLKTKLPGNYTLTPNESALRECLNSIELANSLLIKLNSPSANPTLFLISEELLNKYNYNLPKQQLSQQEKSQTEIGICKLTMEYSKIEKIVYAIAQEHHTSLHSLQRQKIPGKRSSLLTQAIYNVTIEEIKRSLMYIKDIYLAEQMQKLIFGLMESYIRYGKLGKTSLTRHELTLLVLLKRVEAVNAVRCKHNGLEMPTLYLNIEKDVNELYEKYPIEETDQKEEDTIKSLYKTAPEYSDLFAAAREIKREFKKGNNSIFSFLRAFSELSSDIYYFMTKNKDYFTIQLGAVCNKAQRKQKELTKLNETLNYTRVDQDQSFSVDQSLADASFSLDISAVQPIPEKDVVYANKIVKSLGKERFQSVMLIASSPIISTGTAEQREGLELLVKSLLTPFSLVEVPKSAPQKAAEESYFKTLAFCFGKGVVFQKNTKLANEFKKLRPSQIDSQNQALVSGIANLAKQNPQHLKRPAKKPEATTATTNSYRTRK